MSNPRLKVKITGSLSSQFGSLTTAQREIIKSVCKELNLKKFHKFSTTERSALLFDYSGKRTAESSSGTSVFAERIAKLISLLQLHDIHLNGRIILKGYYTKQSIKVKNGCVTYSIKSGGLSYLNRKNVEIHQPELISAAA